MMPPPRSTLHDVVTEVSRHGGYHRLVLVVGPPRSGKTTALRGLADVTGWPRLNINLLVAERLVEVAPRFRQVRVADVLRAVVDDAPGEGVILDNLELLFERSLQLDPLHALLALSRQRTVVAAWCGRYDANVLDYATPGHAEHRRIPSPGCTVFGVEEPTPRTAPRPTKG